MKIGSLDTRVESGLSLRLFHREITIAERKIVEESISLPNPEGKNSITLHAYRMEVCAYRYAGSRMARLAFIKSGYSINLARGYSIA